MMLITRSALRQLAETCPCGRIEGNECGNYGCHVVLALLDEIDRLEKQFDALEKYTCELIDSRTVRLEHPDLNQITQDFILGLRREVAEAKEMVNGKE